MPKWFEHYTLFRYISSVIISHYRMHILRSTLEYCIIQLWFHRLPYDTYGSHFDRWKCCNKEHISIIRSWMGFDDCSWFAEFRCPGVFYKSSAAWKRIHGLIRAASFRCDICISIPSHHFPGNLLDLMPKTYINIKSTSMFIMRT